MSTVGVAALSMASWLRVLTRFVAAQGFCYAANFAAGVALVRVLEPAELAVFTVGFAAFTVANVIADGGVSSAFTAMAAPIIGTDSERLRALYNAVLRSRLRLGVLALAVSLPLLAFSLRRLGVPPGRVGASAFMCTAYVAFAIPQSAGTVILRLEQRYHQLQAVEFLASLVRLAVVLLVVRPWGDGVAALALTVAMMGGQAAVIRYLARRSLEAKPAVDTFSAGLAAVLRHSLPGAVFYALQGQVTIVLLALAAGQLEVASAGALGRIGVLFGLISPAVVNVVAPAFARLPLSRARAWFAPVVAMSALIGLVMVAVAAAASEQILSLLGPQYTHLRGELVLVASTAALGFVSTTVGELNKARAWLRHSWLVIPSVLLTQAAVLYVVRVGTLRGALVFGLMSIVPQVAVGIYQNWAGAPETLRLATVSVPANSY